MLYYIKKLSKANYIDALKGIKKLSQANIFIINPLELIIKSWKNKHIEKHYYHYKNIPNKEGLMSLLTFFLRGFQ
jgi:hypothetical protein